MATYRKLLENYLVVNFKSSTSKNNYMEFFLIQLQCTIRILSQFNIGSVSGLYFSSRMDKKLLLTTLASRKVEYFMLCTKSFRIYFGLLGPNKGLSFLFEIFNFNAYILKFIIWF